jgi:hypothetical protein
MLDGELPAGAVPCTFAAVPASGAGAAGGTAGSGGGCAVSGDGATAPAGSTSAFISVIGCDFDPPVTHPVSVVVWGAGTGGWTSTVAAEMSTIPPNTAVVM